MAHRIIIELQVTVDTEEQRAADITQQLAAMFDNEETVEFSITVEDTRSNDKRG